MINLRKCLGFVLLVLTVLSVTGQELDLDKINAEEELRWGVVAFHSGYYNKAILSFEESLTLKPDNLLTRQWLARAFYHTGLVDAALYEWSSLIESNAADSLLINFYDTVKYRSGLADELKERQPWVPFHQYDGFRNDYQIFRRPTAIVPLNDGTGDMYIVSFISNEIIRINPAGLERARFNGGFEGFDHPFDVLPLNDGRFLVSEYSRDIIGVFNSYGFRISDIGERGIGEGQLLGPQFLAAEGSDYFYVTDQGNRRVSKFTVDGEFILDFGRPEESFPGFKSPTGIAVNGDRVYVADTILQAVYVFDHNGNFIETLITEGLESPEGLYFQDSDTLLIADTSRLLTYDIPSQTLMLVTNFDKEAERITDVAIDVNGHLFASDFTRNTVSMLTEVSELYSGLFVRINRINADSYPTIKVDVSVEDRMGNPFIGLETANFIFSENGVPVPGLEMRKAGYQNQASNIILVMDNRPVQSATADQYRTGIVQLLQEAVGNDLLSLIRTGNPPELLTTDSDEIIGLLPILRGTSESNWNPDIALRLAGSHLIGEERRKAIVFMTTGGSMTNDFESYDILELAAYFRNNNISFYPVYSRTNATTPELNFLAEQTGGKVMHLNQAEGIAGIYKDIRHAANGEYFLEYESFTFSDFGRAYIPLAVEAFYIQKSGKDALGFYAPGDFEE